MKRLLIVVAALVTSACATIPTTGPVVKGQPIDVLQNNGFVRVIARPPVDGMEPAEVVRGFLAASPSLADGDGTALEYLTPQAAVSWTPENIVHVYDAAALKVTAETGGEVSISAPLLATIDSQRRYAAAPAGTLTTDRLRLVRIDGQWRIDTVPAAMLMAAADVERSFRTYRVYFVDDALQRLIPEFVLLPVGSFSLHTQLIESLLAGPTAAWATSVHTAIPENTSLAYDFVAVSGSTATVALDRRALDASPVERRALAAQITWTLTRLGSVAAVRIEVDGENLAVAGFDAVYTAGDFAAFDPAQPTTTARPTGVIVDGEGWVQRDEVRTRLIDTPALAAIAVARDGSRWAAVAEDRRTLLTATSAGAVEQIARGGDLAAPAVLNDGSVWFVDRENDGGVRTYDPVGGVRAVPTGLPKGYRVLDLAIAPDGVRAALIVHDGTQTSLRIGVIDRTGTRTRITSPVRIEQQLTSAMRAAWMDPEQLVVLGSLGAVTVQPITVALARGTVSVLGGPPNVTDITAAPGADVLVSDQAGQLWAYDGGRWSALAQGSAPLYAH